jgi:hypothetical protein
MTDVFDDVIAERDALRQQVATLTQELKHSQAAHAEMRRRDAERVRAIGAEKVAAERQVAALTKALEQIRLFEPQLVESAIAAIRGER